MTLRFSIRTTLLLVIGTLNILIAVLVGFGVYRSWMNLREAHRVKQISITTNDLYNAEKFLSLERGDAIAAIYADAKSSGQSVSDMQNDRRSADFALDQALKRSEAAGSPSDLAVIGGVRDKYKTLNTFRDQLDAALAKPLAQRDPLLASQTYNIITASITEIQALIENSSRQLVTLNPIVAQHVRFKFFIWQITEYAGREYAIIGELIAKNKAPTPEQLDQLVSLRERIKYIWEMTHKVAATVGLDEKLGKYMDEAETHYFLTFNQIKDMFYKPNVPGAEANYPIAIDVWLEMASQAVDSLTTLRDASLHETQLYTEEMEQHAQRMIVVNVFLFLCALALSFYSWTVIAFRVVRPVNAMVDALYNATHGEPFDAPQVAYHEDEIGKLASVLEVFQENSRRIAFTSLQLEEQKNYLKTVLATINDAILTLDAKGDIQMANPAVGTMFGFSEAELLGQNLSLLVPDLPGTGSGGEEFVTTSLQNDIELIARRKDGTIFPAELAITEMTKDDHHFIVSVIRDITQRKKTEDSIRHYLRDLENSNRELDDFAYIASHDLKEPLRGLHNFSRFLLEDYEAKLDTDGKNMLQTIARLTQQMEGLLNALLHYSRLGRTDLSIKETDLNETVHAVVQMYSITVQQQHASVTLVDELPTIVCDHVRISEVFQNLIGNAIKYNDKAEKKIEIGYIPMHPELGEPVYYVRDNGIGIAPQHLDSVFKIFLRLHPRNAFGGGTGSGLTIAKKIINQHGGRIWAESEGEGKGTTFFFTIPPAEPPKTGTADAA